MPKTLALSGNSAEHKDDDMRVSLFVIVAEHPRKNVNGLATLNSGLKKVLVRVASSQT